jgi:hypothetical protein
MAHLLTEIDSFCQRHGLAPTKFGLLALNDKAFVAQIKNGRRVWPETEAKIRKFMSEYAARQSSAAA